MVNRQCFIFSRLTSAGSLWLNSNVTVFDRLEWIAPVFTTANSPTLKEKQITRSQAQTYHWNHTIITFMGKEFRNLPQLMDSRQWSLAINTVSHIICNGNQLSQNPSCFTSPWTLANHQPRHCKDRPIKMQNLGYGLLSHPLISK